MLQEMAAPRSENCFYCTTCSMTLEEITEHVQMVICDVEGEILRRSNTYVPNCKFVINIPKRDGSSQRYCYLWVTNKEVYRMLSDLNYDGRPISVKKTEVDSSLSAREMLLEMDWADVSTSDFGKYTPPQHEHFKISSVVLERVSKAFVEGKLFCATPLPESFSACRISEMFAPFVTSGHLTVARTRNNATISFSNRDDAYFALCMMKKTKVDNLELTFSYCKAR